MQYSLFPSPNVSFRSFGDEVVAANFVRGIYYSMLGSGAQLWEGLMAGLPFDEVVQAVVKLSGSEGDSFLEAARAFVDSLVEEQLIVEAKEREAVTWAPVSPEEGKYGLPELERYTDMQDLLMLDPVHDVQEMGWPHADPVQLL